MMYKIGTLAKKTGYSPNLLRIWEKRYGFLCPQRGQGGQRLYTEDDLRFLLKVKAELQRGRSIGELAQIGRGQLLDSVSHYSQDVFSRAVSAFEPAVCDAIVLQIVHAAAELDQQLLATNLDELFAGFSPDIIVYRIVPELMQEIGDAWMAGKISVAGEHMVSNLVEHRLRILLEAGNKAGGSVRGVKSHVVCACFPDEEHRIGILSVAYFLARHGYPVLYLGASMPFEALENTICHVHAQSVWLSVTREVTLLSHRQQFIELLVRNPQVRFTLGGQALRITDAELAKAGCLFCLYPCRVSDIRM